MNNNKQHEKASAPPDKSAQTADGNPITPERIKGWNESYRQWPARFRQYVTDEGEGILELAVSQALPCGCKATGNGSLQFPLTVKHCKAHANASILTGWEHCLR